MSEKRISILLHLGTNMWRKEGYYTPYNVDEESNFYRDYLATDRETWREVTDFLPTVGINTLLIDMGEAVEMKRHPELAVKGTWSQEEFRAELRRLRSIGLEPLPKFNFSCGHNAWMKEMGYRIDTPEYYAFCRDILEETIELFDTPALFHLGLEEEEAEAQKHQPVSFTRSPERKAYDANFLFDVCRAAGVRPWIWTDNTSIRLWGGEKAFRETVAPDVLLSNWMYGPIPNGTGDLLEKPGPALYLKLQDWGYEQMPTCSTWSFHLNPKMTFRFVREYMDLSRVAGVMSAPWLFTLKSQRYGLLFDAQCLGEANKCYPLDPAVPVKYFYNGYYEQEGMKK